MGHVLGAILARRPEWDFEERMMVPLGTRLMDTLPCVIIPGCWRYWSISNVRGYDLGVRFRVLPRNILELYDLQEKLSDLTILKAHEWTFSPQTIEISESRFTFHVK
jgi:hypothetical protein